MKLLTSCTMTRMTFVRNFFGNSIAIEKQFLTFFFLCFIFFLSFRDRLQLNCRATWFSFALLADEEIVFVPELEKILLP